MATLQKVKLMATQCASLKSPTRSPSPSASPVINLRSHNRHRKTLKMLLSRRIPPSPDRHSSETSTKTIQERRSLKSDDKEVRVRRKLKDLFTSSPEPDRRGGGDRAEDEEDEEEKGLLRDRQIARRRRPFTASFRNRLLSRRRRNWRPVLFTIPEIE